MKGKGGLLLGLAVGYVLGTRSGRARYEQMKRWAVSRWRDPAVQAKVSEVGTTIKEKAKDKAPEVQHRLADVSKKAVHRGRSQEGESGYDPGI
jgi:hypothetical protein